MAIIEIDKGSGFCFGVTTAISKAEVSITPGVGWHKAKGGEKLAETEDDLLEHRTDGTDAFDTLYIGNTLYPYSTGGFGIGSSV